MSDDPTKERTMRAAVFYGAKEGLRVEEVPTPSIGGEDALVKVAACGVCHTDLHYLDHGVPTAKVPPLILGHEISGTVAQVGPQADPALLGRKVILPAVLTCGSCDPCRSGRENICARMRMFGNHIDGGYAQFVRSSSRDLLLLPPGIPLIEGAIIADAMSTPFHAVTNRAQVRPGELVVVIGVGGVGCNAVQFAAAAGGTVVAVDLQPRRRELALTLGASFAIDPAAVADLGKEVTRLAGTRADVALEVVGKPATFEMAVRAVRPGGRVCMVGYSAENASLPLNKVMFQELEIVGSLGARPVDYPKIFRLVQQGKVSVERVVTDRFPLEQVAAAFDHLRGNQGLRSVIVP